MRYEEIDQLIEQAQPIKILRARTASLLISFLYAAFKTRNRITIPSYELTSHLSDYLEQLKNTTFVLDEKGDTLTIARKYIDQ